MFEHNITNSILEVEETVALVAVPGDTYNILRGASVVGVSWRGSGTAISIEYGNTLNVSGYVFGSQTGIDVYSIDYAADAAITINAEGIVSGGSYGIFLDGDVCTVTNHGSVVGSLGGVVAFGESISIFNSGDIRSIDGDGISLYGSGDIINHGSISAKRRAIDGGDGNEHVVNTGDISGAIYLRGGNDRFDSSAGSLFGAIYAGDGNDTVYGGEYEDTVYGGAGNDTLGGGNRDDTLNGGTGADALSGGEGNDTASYAGAKERVTAYLIQPSSNQGDAKGDRYSSIENLIGSNYNDFLVGNTGSNTLIGGGGNDTLDGYGGSDDLDGGKGDDFYSVRDIGTHIFDSAGTDYIVAYISLSLAKYTEIENLYAGTDKKINLAGNTLDNFIAGGEGRSILSGDGGDDQLFGRGDNDTLIGGAGNDLLNGGAGKDTFFFDVGLNRKTNVDRIEDFNVADDTIRLDHAITSTLKAGALSSAAFWKSSVGVAHDADDRIIYDTDSGYLYYDSNGDKAGGSVLFAMLDPHLALTRADFFVV
jgi:serralysin